MKPGVRLGVLGRLYDVDSGDTTFSWNDLFGTSILASHSEPSIRLHPLPLSLSLSLSIFLDEQPIVTSEVHHELHSPQL